MGRATTTVTAAVAAAMLSAFGCQLKLLREQAGYGRVEFGALTGCSASTIEAYEQGRAVAPLDFIRKADEVLQARGLLSVAGDAAAAQTPPVNFHTYAEYERTAQAVGWWGGLLIPGLLQTPAYARAWFATHHPVLSEQTVEELLAMRLERQSLLTREPYAELTFVIGEAALRTPMGGPPVLREQLDRLLECAELRNVQLQVMPFSRGAMSA